MGHRSIKLPIRVDHSFCLFVVLSTVLIPPPWLLAWFIAVLVHELGHYMGLKLLEIDISAIIIKMSGVYMQTASMTIRQELLVAVMGPLFSLVLVLFARWIPRTAICALLHFTFNLLPLCGYDGERIIRCFLDCFLPDRCVMAILRWVRTVVFALLSVLSVMLAVVLKWGMLPIIGAIVVFLRGLGTTFPCKQTQQIVQWSK